jgi:hypothetical protein
MHMQRPPLVAAALLVLSLAGSAAAQQARASGTVRDTDGRPIKGATIRAINEEASPPEITSTSDDRGRFGMIGLRSGPWDFIVEAPGFVPVRATAQMRVAATPPMNFTLAREQGPPPGSLDRLVLQQVTNANALRDKGQFEQALSAYQLIRQQNPKLTSLNMVIAGVYRRQAAEESNPVARRALLERAIDTYGRLLADETSGARAKAEIDSTRAEAEALPR